MQLLSIKVGSFTVKGGDFDKAYSKALRKMKQIEDGFESTVVTFSFKQTTHENEIELIISVYTSVDLKNLEERHCMMCKDMHKHFFLSTRENCDACEYSAFWKRTEDEKKKAKVYAKSVVSKII